MPDDGGFVLPRLLRRPARAITRLFSSEPAVPRHAGAMLVGGLLLATGIYGTAVGGHLPAVTQAVMSYAGFAVDSVKVSGNRETSELDIVQAVGIDELSALVGLDADAARQRIEALPWVQSATVRKVYPDTLQVELVERRAFAVWQEGERLSIIEQDGREITGYDGRSGLPLVVGTGASGRAAEFVAAVATHPELAGQVAGYVRVADRRWNLRMRSGLTVKLPEAGETLALAELGRLQRERDLLSADAVSIDMRLPDRIAVRLTGRAMEGREAATKAKLSSLKKERQI